MQAATGGLPEGSFFVILEAVPRKDVYRIMDEKERLEQAEPLEQEEETPLAAEEETEEEQQTLYFGRFTAGVWHGGVLGIALDFILMGVLGLINDKLSLGLEDVIASPWLKYGLLICLVYGLGKLGGYLEKRREQEGQK